MFRGLAHVPILESATEAVLNHGIDNLLIAILPAVADAEEQIRCLAHALHAAGDKEVRIPSPNGLRCQHRRLESRTAHLVNGVGSNTFRKSGLERRLSCRIL